MLALFSLAAALELLVVLLAAADSFDLGVAAASELFFCPAALAEVEAGKLMANVSVCGG